MQNHSVTQKVHHSSHDDSHASECRDGSLRDLQLGSDCEITLWNMCDGG